MLLPFLWPFAIALSVALKQADASASPPVGRGLAVKALLVSLLGLPTTLLALAGLVAGYDRLLPVDQATWRVSACTG